jgi:hypothetical protein
MQEKEINEHASDSSAAMASNAPSLPSAGWVKPKPTPTTYQMTSITCRILMELISPWYQ